MTVDERTLEHRREAARTATAARIAMAPSDQTRRVRAALDELEEMLERLEPKLRRFERITTPDERAQMVTELAAYLTGEH